MNMSATLIFLLAAAVCVILEALGKAPPWVSKVLIIVVLALLILPK